MRLMVMIAIVALMVAGCGGDDGGGEGSSDSFGLNGTWSGVAEDANFNLFNASATVEDRNAVQLLVDGVNFGETATITRLDSDVFEYVSSFNIYGGLLTDPSKSYAVYVNEFWDFGVLQRNSSAPFGTARITDLNGIWSGSAIGFFADSYFRYTASGSCSGGDCLFTITGPFRDSAGNVIGDLTGQQTTLSAQHWDSLVFNVDWSNPDGSGFGSLFMSKDRNFVGAYLCPPGGILEDCEFAAMVRQ
jgi:hypothetical protein